MNVNDESTNRSELLSKGVKLARIRMLQEKALHNQTVIMGDRNGGIIKMPAKEILARFAKFFKETY